MKKTKPSGKKKKKAIEKSNSHGGKRTGSGRKLKYRNEGKAERIAMSIPVKLLERFRGKLSKDETISSAVTKLIRESLHGRIRP